MAPAQHATAVLLLVLLTTAQLQLTHATPLSRERLPRRQELGRWAASLLPVGEAADRLSGAGGGARLAGSRLDRKVGDVLPQPRRDAVIATSAATGVAAGLAAARAGAAAVDSLPAALGTQLSTAAAGPQLRPGGAARAQPPPRDALTGCQATVRPLLDALDAAFASARAAGAHADVAAADAADAAGADADAAADTAAGGAVGGPALAFTTQRGYVDFGLTSSNASARNSSSSSNCASGCAFNNPAATYGLAVLPLHPDEDAAAKANSSAAPGHARASLDGRWGPRMAPSWQLQQGEVVLVAGCTPPHGASRYFGATAYLYSTWQKEQQQWMTTFGSMGDTASLLLPSAGGAADGSVRATGRLNTTAPLGAGATSDDDNVSDASSTPSLSSLVVVLLGASPDTVAAAQALVYSAVAAAVETAGATGLLPVGVLQRPFINVLPIPGPGFGGDAMGLAPTSNYYTLLLRNLAPAGPAGAAAFAAYAAQQPLRAWRLTPTAPLSGDSSSSSSSYPLPALIPRQRSANMGAPGSQLLDAAAAASSLLRSATPASDEGGSAADAGSEAAPDAAAAAVGTALPAGEAAGTAASADETGDDVSTGATRAPDDSSSTPACLAASCTPQLQALAVATVRAVGGAARLRAGVSRLNPQATAFDRRVRIDALQPSATTRAAGQTDGAAGGTVANAAATAEQGAASSTAADIAAGEAGSSSSSMAPAAWRGAGLGRLAAPPTLEEQQRLLDQLAAALDRRFGGSYALAHGLGAASALSLLGVDSGLDCLAEGLNWCNGDNRDATYQSALPLVTLNRPQQLLLVAGVNFVRAGLASYFNIAVTDPLQQVGLVAFDDEELSAPAVRDAVSQLLLPLQRADEDANGADDAAAAGELLYIVAFSRNCTGVPLPCKPLTPPSADASSDQHSSVPLSRPLLALSRVYVDPATGVGPDASSIAGFLHVLLTPSGVAVPADRRPRVHAGVWDSAGPDDGERAAAAGDSDEAAEGSSSVGGVQGGGGSSRPAAGAAASCERADDDAAEAAGVELRVLQPPAVHSTQLAPAAAGNGSRAVPAAAAMDAGAVGVVAQPPPLPPVDPCVRGLVGMSQCSSQGSADVCCSYVRGWAASDCWCRASGQLLLDSMPASLLTPRLLQLLERVCDDDDEAAVEEAWGEEKEGAGR